MILIGASPPPVTPLWEAALWKSRGNSRSGLAGSRCPSPSLNGLPVGFVIPTPNPSLPPPTSPVCLKPPPWNNSASAPSPTPARFASLLGERAVRIYVARRRLILHPKAAFIRQVYVPGDQVQYDFKDIRAVIAGDEAGLHLFTARLSYSTVWFGHCYRTEDRPALLDGILRSSVEFGGVQIGRASC